jgi:hypothetical protein
MKVRLPQKHGGACGISFRVGWASVSPRLTQVSSSEGWNQSGAWQTSDHATATSKILIKYEGGVGGLKVV